MPAREYRRVEAAPATSSSSESDADPDWPSTACWKGGGSKVGGLLLMGVAGAVLLFSREPQGPLELELSRPARVQEEDSSVEAQYERARIRFEDRQGRLMQDIGFGEEAVLSPDFVDGSSLKRHVRPASRGCPRRKPFPPPPSSPLQYNGIQWPDMCFDDSNESHVFVMGDYGGITCNDHKTLGRSDPNGWCCRQYAGGPYTKTADNTKDHNDRGRYMIRGIDDKAQQLVAKQMNRRYHLSKPHYALNGGDNFYFGGLDNKCGHPMNEIHPRTRLQFDLVFEKMYAEVDVPFFSVFGNHDFGGRHFDAAWDQQIAYTWATNTSGRWTMPSFYWRQRVNYPRAGFSIEYFMVDTNKGDAKYHRADSGHNICGTFNTHGATCARNHGPENVYDCTDWFGKLWKTQTVWLDKALNESDANYKVVVSHFPPDQFSPHFWKDIHYRRGIALFVGSHRHTEEVHINDRRFAGLNWVVVGGGGGISSEWNPDLSWWGRSQYGFMDLTVTKDNIRIESLNEAGEVHQTEYIKPIVYPPIMVDEAIGLAKSAAWKKSNSLKANETVVSTREASKKATEESLDAQRNLDEKIQAEKDANEKLESTKKAADAANAARHDADHLAGDKANAEHEAGRTFGAARHEAEDARREKQRAEAYLQKLKEADEPDPNATAKAKKVLADREEEASAAAAREEAAQKALDKANAEKQAAEQDASAKRDASNEAWKAYGDAQVASRKAAADRSWASRDADKKAGTAKWTKEKAAGAVAAAEKATVEYLEAKKKADAKAYILKKM